MASSWKPEEEEIKEMYRLIEVGQLFPAELNNSLVFILSRSKVLRSIFFYNINSWYYSTWNVNKVRAWYPPR
ncbi:hypothetical protein LguiA_008480 [Lonicera macranthoides]